MVLVTTTRTGGALLDAPLAASVVDRGAIESGAGVGLAYLRSANGSVIDADWVRTGAYQINVGGTLYPITVSLRPLYDPAGERIKTG